MATKVSAMSIVLSPATPFLTAATAAVGTVQTAASLGELTGIDEKKAILNLKFDVVSDGEYFPDPRINSEQCGAREWNLNEANSNELSDDGQAPFYVQMKELINDFGTNSNDGTDYLEMSIYSDYLQQTFRLKDSFLSLDTFSSTNEEILVFTEDSIIPC